MHVQVLVTQIACTIFRHGVIKATGAQIDPHSPQEYCDKVAAEGLIWGCGKPFRLVPLGSEWSPQICDYI